MGNRGEVLAFDLYKGKVRLIQQGAQRLKLNIIKAEMRDAKNPKTELEPADYVLCDAPCSGLGIIRRKPEIRYKLRSAIDSLPDLQYLILCKTSKLVKAGGTLLYSTCTLNPKENNEIATKFLENHAEFEPLKLRLPVSFSRAFPSPKTSLP